jgi:hypothetical protein
LGGRGRQISEFEASLGYRVSSRIARAIQRNPVSKKPKKKKKKKKIGLLFFSFHATNGFLKGKSQNLKRQNKTLPNEKT